VDETAVDEARAARIAAEAKLAQAKRRGPSVARVARQHEELGRINGYAAAIIDLLRRGGAT
jgi:hypothetical protein